jgi:translation initiation factor 3 subunit B
MGINWRQEIDNVGEDADELLDWLSEGDVDEEIPESARLDDKFPNTLVVVNVPIVPEAKFDKLAGFLKKLFEIGDAHEFSMPYGPDGSTQGFFMVTYSSRQEAQQTQDRMHNKEFDKKHTFKVYFVDDFEKSVKYEPDDEEAPEPPLSEVADLSDWMQDRKCREMFVMRFDAAETEIYWHNHVSNQPELEYGGEREKKGGKVWCDSKVQWSPLGSYIATFHKPGIACWGGPKFTKRARLLHADVKQVDFSPNEEYLLTWNGKHSAEKDPDSIKVWHIATGECVKKFMTPSFMPRGGEFPHFLWSSDGRYLARMTETAIHVHDSKHGFECVPDDKGKKAIKFPDGLQGFDWSPSQNIISAWIPEKDNVPARLVILEIKENSRVEIAGKNLFNVRDASMHWQPEGKFLCVKAMRMSRSKKTGQVHLEIFRVMEKNVPVETVEIKESMKSIHWETSGNRFCLLTTDENGHNLKAQFYNISDKETHQVASYDCHGGISHVLWAPTGGYVVLAAIPGGDLIFAQLDEKNKLDILQKEEHFLLTDVHWDPSSRYCFTAATQSMSAGVRYQTESGVKCWSFQGRLLYQQQKEKLFQLAWRPHPPSLLNEKEKKDIRSKLKSYTKRYDTVDESSKEEAKRAQQLARKEQTDKFDAILKAVDDFKQSKWEKTGWKTAFEKLEALSQWEVREEEIEEVIDVKEEPIND